MKRFFDLSVAFLALCMLWPVMTVLALLIWLRLGSPVIFRQVRPGLHGKPFNMLKFRSMLEACDKNGEPLSDNERLTRFGRILRSTSLDELPGLINVLHGDMSIVGPRPLLMEYLSLYSLEDARRHEVKPGITGWAQVNGRNSLSWEEKFKLDVWYVENQSLLLDIRILFLTLKKVCLREDISADGQATTSKFTGRK